MRSQKTSPYPQLSLMVLDEGCLQNGFVTLEEIIGLVSESTGRGAVYVRSLMPQVLGQWSMTCLPRVLTREDGRLVSKHVLPSNSAVFLKKVFVDNISNNGKRENAINYGQWDSVVGLVSAGEIKQTKERIREAMGLVISEGSWEDDDSRGKEKRLWEWINEAKVVADQTSEVGDNGFLELGWEDEQTVLVGLAARELVVEAHEWFVRWQARKFARSYWRKSCGDFSTFLRGLEHCGQEGLLVAIEGYDHALGVKFSSYAGDWVWKKMGVYFRGELSGGVKIDPNLLDDVVRINKRIVIFVAKNGGRWPDQEEMRVIFDDLEVAPEDSKELLTVMRDMRGMRRPARWDGDTLDDNSDRGQKMAGEIVSVGINGNCRSSVEDVIVGRIGMEEREYKRVDVAGMFGLTYEKDKTD